MFRKITSSIFTSCFLLMLGIPLVTTNLQNEKISEAENRKLTAKPEIYKEDGTLNENYTSDFEAWIDDNIG